MSKPSYNLALKLSSYYRGRSAAVMVLRDDKANSFHFSMSGIVSLMEGLSTQSVIVANGYLHGTFTQKKQGLNARWSVA